MWSSIQKTWPIWFIDATGGVLKRISGQNKVLLYSIVMHDKSNKFVCPLSDFFSTGHDMKTISSYFQIIRDALEKYISKHSFQYAPIVVTDFSWALINAVLRTFNNTNFDAYINWCSNILINKELFKINFMPTIIFLCYSHFIKMISKKVFKVKKYLNKSNQKKLHRVALYSCAVLQRSTNMENFSKNLRHLFNIFNTKYESKDIELSLKAIKENVVDNGLNNDTEFRKIINNKEQNQLKKNIIYIENSNHKSYRNNSPFLNYFLKIIKYHKTNVNRKKRIKSCNNINSYYCPKIFKIIFHYIHLMPLWSKVLINLISGYYKIEINNLTNNPVENWFDQLKESLASFLPVMPSQFANFMFSVIETLYEIHPAFKSIKLKNYRDYGKESKENWSKFRKDLKRRDKSFYSTLISNNDPFDNEFIFESLKLIN